LKKKKPVRAVIDTNLFVSGLFAAQGYSSQLQQLWGSGTFELAVSEQILKEIENTLLKPHIRKRLFLKDGEQESIISLIREKAFVVTADLY
jgi:putative PIN family toxin of toxin-antitoxin system